MYELIIIEHDKNTYNNTLYNYNTQHYTIKIKIQNINLSK